MSFQIPNFSSDFILEPQGKRTDNDDERVSQWALSCFTRSSGEQQLLELHLSSNVASVVEKEPILYHDRHTRDSDFGHHLIEPYRDRLEQLVKLIKDSAVREQRQGAAARARLEAMKRVNAVERNPALRYPNRAIDEAQAEVNRMKAQQVSATFLVSVHSLERLLLIFTGEEGNSSGYECEQALRMLSQGAKGYFKIIAFNNRFTLRNRLRLDSAILPGQPPVQIGLKVALNDWLPHDQGILNLILTPETAAYLYYQFASAVALWQAAKLQWDVMRSQYGQKNFWPLLYNLLRNVIDLYHFCAFEMPFALQGLALDRSDNNRVVRFASDNNYQVVDERRWVDKPLKRWIAESLNLIPACDTLLAESGPQFFVQLQALAKRNPLAFVSGNFQPYLTFGLANLPARGAVSAQELTRVCDFTNSILAAIVNCEQESFPIAASEVGNWLSGIMNIDSQLFALPPEQPAIEQSERAFLLSNFWNELGNWRVAGLLGQDYCETIADYCSQYAKAEETEAEPEVAAEAAADEYAAPVDDPLNIDILGLLTSEDQSKLFSLINLAWQSIRPTLVVLSAIKEGDQLGEIVASFMETFASHIDLIVNQFPAAWAESPKEVWSMLRLAAPTACDLLSQMCDEPTKKLLLANVDVPFWLGSLLRLAGDLTRLKVVIEACSPDRRTQFIEKAEPSARLFLRGGLTCNQCVHAQGIDEVGGLDEVILSYFDEDHFHNAWHAFVDRTVFEMEQFVCHLNSQPTARQFCNLLSSAMIKLQQLKK